MLVPLVWLAILALDRERLLRLERAVGPRVRALAPSLHAGQRRLRRSLLTAGLLFALLAVLQPVWGEGFRRIEQRGVDIVICLDVSHSMLARDLPPSRLERAKRDVRALAERIRGDRLGLVAFAGEARLIVPLTQDVESFSEMTDQADPLSVGRGGTDVGAALMTALGALEGQSGEHEVVLLLTDGEDLEQRGLRIAEECRSRNITVHCIGLGSVLGSKIALEGGEGFLRDRAGHEVVSAMDSASLARIAQTTGGEFLDAGLTPQAISDIYERRIRPLSRKSIEADLRRERPNRFQWPLLAAVVLWILELCLTDRTVR